MPRTARSLLAVAIVLSSVAAGTIPKRQDDTEEPDGTETPTTVIYPSKTHKSTLPSHTSHTVVAAATSSVSHPSSNNSHVGSKIAGICIPLVFLLALFWCCSPCGPEGKARRRRRDHMERVRAQVHAGNLRREAEGRAATAQRETAGTNRAADVVYMFTGLRRTGSNNTLPVYNSAAGANEVVLMQGRNPAVPAEVLSEPQAPATALSPTTTTATPVTTAAATSPTSILATAETPSPASGAASPTRRPVPPPPGRGESTPPPYLS